MNNLLEHLKWFNRINGSSTTRDPVSQLQNSAIKTKVVFYVTAVSLNSPISWQFSILGSAGTKSIQDFLIISDLRNKSAWNGMLKMPDSPTYKFIGSSTDEMGKYCLLSRNVFVPQQSTDSAKRCDIVQPFFLNFIEFNSEINLMMKDKRIF